MRSTWISKSRAQIVTSTPSPSPPASASAFATADSLAPKNRSTRRSGSRRAREHALQRLRLDRPRPQALQLAGRTRQHDDHARARVEDDARGRAGDAERERPLREASPACGRRREIRVRAAHPLGEPARDLLDLGLESLVEHERPPGHARHELDRPVVVRRPESARDEADIGLESFAQGGLELGRIVADDRDPRGLEPEPERLPRVERAVQISPLAANELASRYDDGGARAVQEAGETVRRPLCGTLTRVPATRTTTLRGDATDSESLRDANRLRLPSLERAAVERLACAGADPHLHERGPLRRRHRDAVRDRSRCRAGRHVDALHLRLGRAAELPGRDHESRQDDDRRHGDGDETRLAMLPLAPALRSGTRRVRRGCSSSPAT